MASPCQSAYLELISVLQQPQLDEIWGPDIEEYMNELSGMGLSRLLQEPQRLNDERDVLLESTQELAFSNYKTFVETANCSRDIRSQMTAVGRRLESLRRKLPVCAITCEGVSTACADITARWKLTSQTLGKHRRLVEILEIPQLMESCVKNGNFDEALELASHVRRLERRHGSSIPLVAAIGHEVRHQQGLLQGTLLAQLRGPLQLPACLRLIGHLRRMETYSSHDLKARFLETRGAWFDSLLAQLDVSASASGTTITSTISTTVSDTGLGPSGIGYLVSGLTNVRDSPVTPENGPASVNTSHKRDAYSHLSRLLELYRVHLFDLITQYKAIFPPVLNAVGTRETNADNTFVMSSEQGNDPVASTFNSMNAGKKMQETVQVTEGFATNDEDDVHLFQGWLVGKVDVLLQRLRDCLAADAECRLDALVSQCMYAGLSFSRVGVDFRSLLMPIFETALNERCEKHLEHTFLLTTRHLNHLDLTGVAKWNETSPIELIDCNGPSRAAPESLVSSESTKDGGSNTAFTLVFSVPSSALAATPLALYCNGLVHLFNELRVCPLAFSIVQSVARVSDQLKIIARTIRERYRVGTSSRAVGDESLAHSHERSASSSVSAMTSPEHPGAKALPLQVSKNDCDLESALTEEEVRGFQRLAEIFVADVVPFAARGFELLLPTSVAARIIGCPLHEAEHCASCRIDVSEVIQPLSEFVYQEDALTLDRSVTEVPNGNTPNLVY